MYTQIAERCIAFDGMRCIAEGDLMSVARKVKEWVDAHDEASVLVFDAESSFIVELDLRGTMREVLAVIERRLREGDVPLPVARGAKKGPGRPKMGVVPREVTLLPRHWEWLERQPGGASVTLRKLVEEARKDVHGTERRRAAQEACYRFMNAVAGDLPGFQEALRALYANDRARFEQFTESWPSDVRRHVRVYAERSWNDAAVAGK